MQTLCSTNTWVFSAYQDVSKEFRLREEGTTRFYVAESGLTLRAVSSGALGNAWHSLKLAWEICEGKNERKAVVASRIRSIKREYVVYEYDCAAGTFKETTRGKPG